MKFEHAGFLIILLEETFDAKAIDYWEFRTFRYDEIKSIKYYKEGKFWNQLRNGISFMHKKFDPYKLKLKKMNGGCWDYNCHPKETQEFNVFVNELKERCKVNKSKFKG